MKLFKEIHKPASMVLTFNNSWRMVSGPLSIKILYCASQSADSETSLEWSEEEFPLEPP